MVSVKQGSRRTFIENYTEDLLNEGFVVYNELPGYLPPPTIGYFKPDILAKNQFQKLVITVKNAEAYDKDSPELEAFRQYCSKTPGASFLVFAIDEDGEWKLVETTEKPRPEG